MLSRKELEEMAEILYNEWSKYGSLKDFEEDLDWYVKIGYRPEIKRANRKITGFILHRNGFPENSRNIGYIIVRPEYRRRGIGTELLRKCEMESERNGENLIFLESDHISTYPFWFARGYKIVDKLVLTYYDCLPSYMFVKSMNPAFELTPSKLLNIYDGFVEVMYEEKERKKYEKFFELGRKQIENIEEIRLTTKPFLKDYPLKICKEIGISKLENFIKNITQLI